METDKGRRLYNLNLDWRFHLGDAPRAWQKSFDDSAWLRVNIPHDWSVSQPFDRNHSSGTGYLPGGTGIYRKQFFLPEAMAGKRVYVKFDGVYNNSMVWCNSYYLGKRPYGYTEFIYDITDFACFGDTPNLLAVQVDHRHVADSRWFTGSGIYRKVTVMVKDSICIDNYGVFVSVKTASKENASVTVKTTALNTTDQDAGITIRNLLYDHMGSQVSCCEGEYTISPNEGITSEHDLEVDAPKRWSVDSPYLYTCITEILKDGTVIDREETITGIRTFTFDADNGFYLNGEGMKLKGVCVHHDAGCLGAAVRKKVWKRRLLHLKEMGCNAIRMSHNPHMPELYDLCDELGFLVIDEAFDEWEGVKNKWAQGHNVYPPAHYGYYEDFSLWHEKDLAAMVLRDRNHPSIILWSIGNEVDYPNDPYCHVLFDTMTGNNDANKPAAERVYDPGRPSADRLAVIAKELVAIVKKHDLTRPVTAALAFPELSNLTGYADCLDVVGYNYKEHLYDEDHIKYPDRILLGSENGKNLEQWLAVRDKAFISGQFLWTGIDFLGETGGWPSHGSEAGVLDIAGFKKPSYYFRRSLWYNGPVVKLFAVNADNETHRRGILYDKNVKPAWNYLLGDEIRVICFTNCVRTELFLNGRSLGQKGLSDGEDGYLTWIVPFEKGALRAVAVDEKGDVREDVIKTSGGAAGMRLSCTDMELTADGQDMTHVVLEIVDTDGNTVSNAQDLIHVSLEGPGEILGLENGNLEDTTAYALPCRRAYNGRLLIYVGSLPEEGSIKIKAEAEKLGPCEVAISSR